jgi:hypothetical protein
MAIMGTAQNASVVAKVMARRERFVIEVSSGFGAGAFQPSGVRVF